MKKRTLVGIFDSGVGGLTVARKVEEGLPETPFIYFGDTLHVPYGERRPEEVVGLIDNICHHLIAAGAEALVMACNTSSALAYEHVRAWSEVPVIGIIAEAAKAAVAATRCGHIGVIANMLTASSGAYESSCAEAANGMKLPFEIDVTPVGCPKLVPLIERGEIEGPNVEAALREYWAPMAKNNVDTIVLGCTHYPFVRPVLERIAGPGVTVIDPAYYVVERLKSLGFGESPKTPVRRIYQASGSAEQFAKVGSSLLGRSIGPVEHISL